MAKTITLWSPNNGDTLINSALLQEILGGDAGGNYIDTPITTVGNGTLTAAGLVGGQITRTGPVAAYSDATDTAAAIVAALGSQFTLGQSFNINIKNATPFAQTITAGTGVTLPASIVVPPISMVTYSGTVGGTAAAPTVAVVHVATVPIRIASYISDPQALALTTVGAGTITAAGFAAGITARGGTQTVAFTDTTDTAVAIIAGVSSLNIVGSAVLWRYVNNTVWPATLHAGVGVTLTDLVVPANSWAALLVTYSAAGAVTMTPIAQGVFPVSGTFVCNGATPVTVANAAFTANSSVTITLKTVGGTVGAIPHLATVTPQTGFTVVGTASDTSTYTYEIRG